MNSDTHSSATEDTLAASPQADETVRRPWITPNQVTCGRMVLAVAYLAALAWYDPSIHGRALPLVCLVMFIVAAVTDLWDGYLARKYNMITSIGRMLDPFVDKVLVLGSFILLAGDNYVLTDHIHPISGVSAWMVIVIVARELLVTSVRGLSEGQGRAFAATVYGKAKMAVQSVTVGVVLGSLALFDHDSWLLIRIVCAYVATAVTFLSMLAYLGPIRAFFLSDIPAQPVQSAGSQCTPAQVHDHEQYRTTVKRLHRPGMKLDPRVLAVSFFGTGYLRPASGTWGSAAAAGLYVAILWLCRTLGLWCNHYVLAVVLAALAVWLGVACGKFAVEYYGRKDPSRFVLDEAAGQWVAMLVPLPVMSEGWPFVVAVGVQFVLFRIFDIIKPPPIQQLERLPNGWGIVFDDVAAGVYAAIVGWLVLPHVLGML